MTVELVPLNIVDEGEPVPATITFLTDSHIDLYSLATGPGGSTSKKA